MKTTLRNTRVLQGKNNYPFSCFPEPDGICTCLIDKGPKTEPKHRADVSRGGIDECSCDSTVECFRKQVER